jgi:hypothetical protein
MAGHRMHSAQPPAGCGILFRSSVQIRVSDPHPKRELARFGLYAGSTLTTM